FHPSRTRHARRWCFRGCSPCPAAQAARRRRAQPFDGAMRPRRSPRRRPRTALSRNALFSAKTYVSFQLPASSFQLQKMENKRQIEWLKAGSWKHLIRVARALDVGDAQFQIRFPLELVLFEREGQIDAGAVLVEEVRAFRGAPCNRPETA